MQEGQYRRDKRQRCFLRQIMSGARYDAVGARLFVRTTRSLRAIKDSEALMSTSKDVVSDSLRLPLPSELGRNQVLGWIEKHLADHPLDIDISIGDTLSDLHAQPVDLTIRYGIAKDSSLISLPIAPDKRRILCASPAYLKKHGPLVRLEQLARHNCLRFKLIGIAHSRGNFGSGAESIFMVVDGNRVSDDAELVRRWAIAGLGIAYKSALDVAADLQAGRLAHWQPEVAGEAAPLTMYVAHRSLLTPAVHALARFLKERCQAHLSAHIQPAGKAGK